MAKFAAVIDAASADSGPPAVPAPHYRGRLRGRVLKADIEPLPNYELPGLLLFYSIERIDTEPLAKCLIEASRRSVTSSPPNPPSCASSRSTSERWRGRKSHVSFRKNVLIA